jgi:hypothetical protein
VKSAGLDGSANECFLVGRQTYFHALKRKRPKSKCQASSGSLGGRVVPCAPQKVDPTSRCNFFEPVFMVQPAENILHSYPAIGWQLMPMDAWARPRSTTRIRDSGSQARMWSSLIVVGHPLPQDRPQMRLARRDHVIQAFTADRSHRYV